MAAAGRRIMAFRLPVVIRSITTTSSSSSYSFIPRRYASNFASHPSPPRLPAEQQAEFERLQRAAATAAEGAASASATTTTTTTTTAATATAVPEGTVSGGAPPEFEGDVNPKTGEVGGPKNEPLRWGSAGDWSYNGKVTDF